MRTIIVLNPKGGCGKTTIATSLAAYYASQYSTALLDYDPQNSCSRWLKRRPEDRPLIKGMRAFDDQRMHITRSWMLHNPDLERMVIDAPAAISGHQLFDLIRQVDVILIPVLPSPIDIHATADFIKDLLLEGKARALNVRIGVVANRVRQNTLIYNSLMRFLFSLKLPFVASLRDTQNYVKCAESGLGIHEINASHVKTDIEQWQPLIEWLEHGQTWDRSGRHSGK